MTSEQTDTFATILDLLKEKTLWQVYKQSRRVPESPFNRYTTAFMCVLCTVYVLYVRPEVSALAETVRGIADSGLNVGAALFGFIVAGFTIFATLGNPEMFVRMNRHTDDRSGLSLLKHNFYIFLRVFTCYIGFMLICLSIKVIGFSHGPIAMILDFNSTLSGISRRIVVGTTYVIICSYFVYIIAVLQSFVFAIYHSVMTNIAGEVEKQAGKTPPT